jgi:photosystem II stability/assembly factor-like uncharacterized protein
VEDAMKQIAIVLTFLIMMTLPIWASHDMYDENGIVPRNFGDKSKTSSLNQNNSDDLRNVWEGVGPWGGDVTSLAICQETTTTIYAALGNPYISDDAGATWNIWQNLASHSTTIRVITTISGGTYYAGGNYNDGLFKSVDSGETWSHINNFPISMRDITVITVDPVDSQIIYVGVSGNSAATNWTQIAKSTDGGSTWSVLATNALGITMGISDIAVDPANTQKIVVSCEGGIGGGDAAYSSDGGTSWQNISAGLPYQYPFNDIEISGTDVFLSGGQLFGSQHVGVYKAQMGEFTWQNISTSFPLPVVNEVIVNPDNNQFIYAATEGDGIYISADGGNSWSFTTSGADNFSIFDLILNPDNSMELYIGCKSMAVYKSIDMGASWHSANFGIAILWVNDIAVDPTNPDNIIVGFEAENSGGCYMSNDGGITWNVVEALPATRFSAVAFDTSGNVYACSQGPTTVAPEGVYKSTDGGVTWNNTGPDLGPNFETELYEIEISDTDNDLIYTSGNHFGNGGWASTVYRTYDAGTSDWEEVYIGPDDFSVRAVDLAPSSNDQIIYAGTFAYNGSTSFLKSTDQGDSWQSIDTGVPANCCQSYSLAVDPYDNDLVYAGTGHYSVGYHIMKTDDGGANWSSIYSSNSSVSSLIIDPDDNDHLYAALTNANVVMSNDAGQGWLDAGDGLAFGSQMSRFSNSFEVNGETRFYVGTYNRSAFVNTMDISSELNPPNNVQIEIAGFNDVLLTWEEPDLTSAVLIGYKIYRDGNLLIEISNPNTLEYLDEGLDAGVYEYYMTAVYVEGESDSVGLGEVIIILPAPTDLSASYSPPYILLSWNGIENRELVSYNIYRNGVFVSNVLETFYLDSDLTFPITYVYNVAGVFTGSWEGEWSADEIIEIFDAGQNLVNLQTRLQNNYPNPFNPETAISFSTTESTEQTELIVYNMKGQKVKQLISEQLSAGQHSTVWNGTDDNGKSVSNGVYFYKMKSGNYQETKKMILLK